MKKCIAICGQDTVLLFDHFEKKNDNLLNLYLFTPQKKKRLV